MSEVQGTHTKRVADVERLGGIQCRLANLLEGMQTLWQGDVHIAVAKSTLDPFLQAVNDVESRRQAQHGDGRLARLCDIKKVIQQRLPRMRGEEIELVDDEDHRLGGRSRVQLHGFGVLGMFSRMRKQGKDRRQIISIATRRSSIVLDLHLAAQLPPDVFERELIIRVDKAVQTHDVKVIGAVYPDASNGAFDEVGLCAAAGADEEDGVAFAGNDGLQDELVHFLVFVFEAVEGKAFFAS